MTHRRELWEGGIVREWWEDLPFANQWAFGLIGAGLLVTVLAWGRQVGGWVPSLVCNLTTTGIAIYAIEHSMSERRRQERKETAAVVLVDSLVEVVYVANATAQLWLREGVNGEDVAVLLERWQTAANSLTRDSRYCGSELERDPRMRLRDLESHMKAFVDTTPELFARKDDGLVYALGEVASDVSSVFAYVFDRHYAQFERQLTELSKNAKAADDEMRKRKFPRLYGDS